jgi:hypothetical protein
MLTLREQQQALFEILRGRAAEPEPAQPRPSRAALESDPWLRSVLASPGLRILRRSASWWQRFQIESYCRYTARLMKRLGCFSGDLEAHFAAHPAPPFVEEMTAQFLSSLSAHENPLLRAVAQFELFCMAPARSPARATEISEEILWDRNPEAVLLALDRFLPLPSPEPGVLYRLRLSSTGPVTCTREPLPKKPHRREPDRREPLRILAPPSPSSAPPCAQQGSCRGQCAGFSASGSAQCKSASSPA